MCREFFKQIQGEFEMSLMRELTFFHGLQIKQGEEGTFFSQTKYALKLLKKFDMQDCKPISTPMASALSIDMDGFGIDVDCKRYRGMIRSFLYLITSKPDIMFSVYMCARHEAYLKECHFKIVKRILRYLSGTTHFGLLYPNGGSCCLVGFSDSDFTGCKTDRKTTSGTCHLFRNYLILWHNKKQHSVPLSTNEAEYVATPRSPNNVKFK